MGKRMNAAAEALVVKMAKAGKSTRAIAKALEATGCKRDHSSISRFLKSTTSATNPAKAIAREALSKALPTVLDDVENERGSTARIVAHFAAAIERLQALESRTPREARELGALTLLHARVSTRFHALSDLALRFSGAGEPDASIDDGAAERVVAKLESIVQSSDVDRSTWPTCPTCTQRVAPPVST